MATRLSTAARNAASNAVAGLIDADVGAGALVIRTGAQPASAEDPATGTILATFAFADPATTAAVVGVSTFDTTPVLTTTGVATGTAGWFRITDNSGDTVMDGSVTATGGGGELELNTTSITTGVTVEITAGTLTTPATT